MKRDWRTLHILGGPLVFLLLSLIPSTSIVYPVRASLGLLLWMSWWWIFEPVNLAVTGFLPLVVLAIFNFHPVARILPSYAEELIFLLLGANILSTVWTRWGLDRRIALVSLIGVGTGTRRQIIVWFAIATLLSAFLPNTVVAAALMPIALAMLRFIGIQDVGRSAFGSAVLIAIAWGTSVGGFWTPLGGAPNLLTIRLLQQTVISHEFLFMTWVTRLLPLTVAIGAVSFLFVNYAFRPELEQVEGTREYFSRELRSLGPLTMPEKWGLCFLPGGDDVGVHPPVLFFPAPGLQSRLRLSDLRRVVLRHSSQRRAAAEMGLRAAAYGVGFVLPVCRGRRSWRNPQPDRHREVCGRCCSSHTQVREAFAPCSCYR